MIEAKIEKFLNDIGIKYEIMPCDPQLADTEDFCNYYNIPKSNSGNTLIIASKKDPIIYSACLVTAEYKLDVNKTVRKLMGVRRLSFASAEQTVEVTGMIIGGVTPIALPSHINIYIDKNIENLNYIILGGGSRSQKIKIDINSLAKIPNAEFVEGLGIPL